METVGEQGISGSTEWTRFRFLVSAGSYTYRWTYEKDGSVDRDNGAAYIDLVILAKLPLTAREEWIALHFPGEAHPLYTGNDKPSAHHLNLAKSRLKSLHSDKN